MYDSGWFYAGEITDPEQAPVTQAVYSCDLCGALVAGSSDNRAVHERWHATHDRPQQP